MTARGLLQYLEAETKNLQQAGLLRPPLELTTPQGAHVRAGGRDLVNFASSDYLGLATHPEVKKAAAAAIETWGVGVASPRTAMGTLSLHLELERTLAQALGAEDALVFASGHHANTGLFESLVSDRDFVFCDEMASPSLADGIRLSRARAYAYRNDDMQHLEDRLKRSRAARFLRIVTDGVFTTMGQVASLKEIYALAAKYRATVVTDDSEGFGVVGEGSRGTHGFAELTEGIDLVTGSFGRALGGGTGGFVAGSGPLVAWLRQKSRPHLSSSALAPPAVAAAKRAIELTSDPAVRRPLSDNLKVFQDAMARDAGLTIHVTHPAISVLVRSAVHAQRLVDLLFQRDMFVIGACPPLVPEGQARISVRVTAQHRPEELETMAKAIGEGMRELKIQL